MNGFIKLHRQLIEWEWYSDIKVCRVFLHLLLTANFKDGNWRGQGVKRGQVIIGKESLGKTLGLSIQEVKTVFKKLKKTGEISTKATNRFVIVTICNFDSYQDKEAIEKGAATNKQPTSNQQATNKEPQRKNDKKEKKERIKEIEESSLPESLKELATEYLKMRSKIGKKLKTPRAINTKLNRLVKYVKEFGEQKTIDCLNLSLDNEWQDIKMEWLENEQKQKPHSAKCDNSQPQKLDLEAYIIQQYREVDLKHMKKDGRFQRWEAQLKENSFKLSNIAKGYKNEHFSTLFLFEALFMPLGKNLGGSSDRLKLESLQRWLKTLSDYNLNKGDLRKLLKNRNKNLTA